MDQMISDFFDEFGGSRTQEAPTSPLDYVPATFYSQKLDAGDVPEDATISFAHFYARFGNYIPQVISGHTPYNPNPNPNPNPHPHPHPNPNPNPHPHPHANQVSVRWTSAYGRAVDGACGQL